MLSKNQRTQVVLLLADGFDQTSVTVLTTLRQAGFLTRLIGLRIRSVCGAYGLVIVPDMSLDQVLAKRTPISALILPGGAGHLGRLRADPRVSILLKQCIAQETMLIGLNQPAAQVICELSQAYTQANFVLTPEPDISLEEFTQYVMGRL